MTKAPEKKTPSKPAAKASAGAKAAAPQGSTSKGAASKGATSKGATSKGATIDKPKPGSKPNALQQPLQPSPELALVVGEGTMPRGQVVSKVWEYIKAHKLQNPADGREIVADETLKKVFGKPKVTMFEMNKLLAAHLK